MIGGADVFSVTPGRKKGCCKRVLPRGGAFWGWEGFFGPAGFEAGTFGSGEMLWIREL